MSSQREAVTELGTGPGAIQRGTGPESELSIDTGPKPINLNDVDFDTADNDTLDAAIEDMLKRFPEHDPDNPQAEGDSESEDNPDA